MGLHNPPPADTSVPPGDENDILHPECHVNPANARADALPDDNYFLCLANGDTEDEDGVEGNADDGRL